LIKVKKELKLITDTCDKPQSLLWNQRWWI